ncbi:MAG TPA: glycosyltransferase family 25 protein [Blastocatellia bacterium]|nr:glycosyltransferase family 25 protein [Blastocatellia bacterium]
MTPQLGRRDLDSFFTHKVCVNLDRRPERWARMIERFAKHKITGVVRFSAIDGERSSIPPGWKGSAGAYGCLQSNLSIIQMARESRWPEVLILEDDVVFDEDLAGKFPEFIAQLPPDWDMVFFGGLHRIEPVLVSENLLKLSSTTSTYAYAVRDTVYSAFLDLQSASQRPVDVNNRLLQERFNCYCFFPNLAWVEGGHSDTLGRALNPWWLKESLLLVGPEMDLIQRRTLLVIPHRDRTPDRLGVRNLRHVVNAYTSQLQGISIAVVEQDQVLSLNPGELEYRCDYIPIKDGGPLNRGMCFNEAVRRFGADKDFFVFADRDIFMGWEVKAILRKCLSYDFVSCFSQLIDLTEDDTVRLVSQKKIDGSAYKPRPRTEICAEFCTFTRTAFERIGGWDETVGKEGDEIQSRKTREMLSMFESPGLAFRLSSGASENSRKQRCG